MDVFITISTIITIALMTVTYLFPQPKWIKCPIIQELFKMDGNIFFNNVFRNFFKRKKTI